MGAERGNTLLAKSERRVVQAEGRACSNTLQQEERRVLNFHSWNVESKAWAWRMKASAENRPPRASKAKYSLWFYPERSERCLEVWGPRMHDRICFWKQITLLTVQRLLQQRQKRIPITKPWRLFAWRLKEVTLSLKEKWGSWVKGNESGLGRSNQAKQKSVSVLRNAKIIHYSWRTEHKGGSVL